jgi:DNA-binding winged helix-turn-helix (wHTH) protein
MLALRFDAFILDTLLRDCSEVPLRRQSFDVLHHLAVHIGRVVSSEELVQAVWVSKPADHNASVVQSTKEIRRALGNDARRIIKAVSGRGYAFKAELLPPLAAGHLSESELPPAHTSQRAFWRSNGLFAAASVVTVVAGWMLWRQQASTTMLTMMAAPSVGLVAADGTSSDGSAAGRTVNEIALELRRTPRGYDLVIVTNSGRDSKFDTGLNLARGPGTP